MRYAILTCLVLVAALLIWQRGNRSPTLVETKAPEANIGETQIAALKARRPDLPATPVPYVPAPGTTEDLHAKAETLMRQWVAAAKPFNYDPVITGFYDRTNKDGRITIVGITTKTHFIEIMRRSDGDMVASANSSYDSDRTTPENEANWYQCTGKWTEKEAIAETRAILERMGATQTLVQITRHTYEATPLQLPAPEGKTVTVTPFVVVEFYAADGKRLLEAQYRMAATGPSGLVRWWHWP